MGTIVQSISCLSWRNNRQIVTSPQSRIRAAAGSPQNSCCTVENEEFSGALMNRRGVIASGVALVSSAAFGFPGDGLAVVKQGLLAGRIPGLSEPDEQGWRTYQRPDDKSGGHGVGWSPIIPYLFSVPQDWEEVPVSIADLGGTEIDLRFASAKQGRIFVIVAPVLRFADNLGDNATIEQIGTPEKVINAFGPEVIGENVEGKVLSAAVAEHSGRKYYQFELEPPHVLITATAAGNRLYLFSVTGNGLQWKKHYKDLKRIAESFRVV
ncbi:PsbP domain-containing protein 4, chloroplastic [Sesamum alatum]|uniref:PsbP domain-containing protein 4, chloroplastic n=1 Tax=Sesamum alatum TaxID=300844 RepID=A0AAE2CTN6_9LAMI|nr:PsbP domain-containing protein 4, chloroplastic [Sesamum alatum]